MKKWERQQEQVFTMKIRKYKYPLRLPTTTISYNGLMAIPTILAR